MLEKRRKNINFGMTKSNSRLSFLHNEGSEKKLKYMKLAEEKEKQEVEDAYMMALKPTQKLNKVRSLEKFMLD